MTFPTSTCLAGGDPRRGHRSPEPVDDYGNAIYPFDAWLRIRGLTPAELPAEGQNEEVR